MSKADDSSKPKNPYEELTDAERADLHEHVAICREKCIPRSLWFTGIGQDRLARAYWWLEWQANAPPAQPRAELPAIDWATAPTEQTAEPPAPEQTPPASAPAQQSSASRPLAAKEWYTRQFGEHPKPAGMTATAYGRQLATAMKLAAEAGEVSEALSAKTLSNRYAEWLKQSKRLPQLPK